MPTFDYLTRHVIHALNIIEKENENLILGGFCGSVMELLGRILLFHKSEKTKDRIGEFIIKFLTKYNSDYGKYKDLLIEDLRHGGAHSILPKGGTVLTGDRREKNKHLKIGQDPKTKRIYLVIFTPTFLSDLRSAIFDFVSEAKNNPTLAKNYDETIREVIREGKKYIENVIKRDGLQIDFVEHLGGDIKI